MIYVPRKKPTPNPRNEIMKTRLVMRMRSSCASHVPMKWPRHTPMLEFTLMLLGRPCRLHLGRVRHVHWSKLSRARPHRPVEIICPSLRHLGVRHRGAVLRVPPCAFEISRVRRELLVGMETGSCVPEFGCPCIGLLFDVLETAGIGGCREGIVVGGRMGVEPEGGKALFRCSLRRFLRCSLLHVRHSPLVP